MLQQSEYDVQQYQSWWWRVSNFSRVAYRKALDKTRRASILRYLIAFIWASILIMACGLIYFGLTEDSVWPLVYGVAIVIFSPLLLAHLLIPIVYLIKRFIVEPRNKQETLEAKKLFASTNAKKIVVLGSYGKTSMKQMLAATLGSKLKIAATEGNMNTAIAHARFAKRLVGDEELLIIELGEYMPGDIEAFCQTIEPDYAVITGANEAHLENFGTIEKTVEELLTVSKYVPADRIFIATDNERLRSAKYSGMVEFGQSGVGEWKVEKKETSLTQTAFRLVQGRRSIAVESVLIGDHQIAPLSLAVHLADHFKMNTKEIKHGISLIAQVPHRMQPRLLSGNVLVVDDTYNGNIDGVRAGLKLLEKTHSRRVYITPGLVETGDMTEELHVLMGEMIADVADVVYLIKNSVTSYIQEGLQRNGFKGEVEVVDDPLLLYTNLETISKSGDVILLQNDWTDNYH